MSQRDAVLLIGGGGHAKVVLELLGLLGWDVAGVVDDDPPRARETLVDVPVLGDTSRLPALRAGAPNAVVAIGDNRIRLDKAAQARALGFTLVTAVHPRATVSSRASLGPGTVVMAGAVINTGATVDHDCVLEDGVHVSPGAHLAGGVHVGTLAHVGIGASVIENVVVGARAVVAAGAVVVSDVPDDVLALGVPARVVERSRR